MLFCLSVLDVTVTGVSFDAAGNNRRMVKYLLGGEVTISNGLPKKVSFPNVFLSTDNVIFIWYCSTHNLKSARNQLLSSTGDIKAARVFHDWSFVPFGWQAVIDQWKREQERLNKGEAQLTDLSVSAVYPDK